MTFNFSSTNMELEFKVEHVDYQDGPTIADIMMRAMYEEEHFSIQFNRISLQKLIDDTIKRISWNLCSERDRKRHAKVVHVETGSIVGYARWVLPESVAGEEAWKEAQTRQPTDEEKSQFKRDFDSTMENGRRRIQNHEVTRGPLGSEKGDCFDELSKDGQSIGIRVSHDFQSALD
jgi:hypothetical protein